MSDRNYDITVTDADPFSFGLFQVEKRFLVPPASLTKAYMDSIIRIVRSGNIQILIPGTEVELLVLAQNRTLIESQNCVLLANPLSVVELCANKWLLAEWLSSNGFLTPRSAKSSDWQLLANEVGFPLIGKPTVNTGGSRHVAILKDESELLRYLEETANIEVIFQEYIDAADDEYTVGVCVDASGHIIDSIVIKRKLTGLSLGTQRVIKGRTYTLSTGYSQGFIIDEPKIRSVCENLVMSLGGRGPLNIQCRLIDDKVIVFEVHPRFSGTTSIRADVGFNEVDLLIRNFLF
ncbi:MAG: ATP-grasp domain-containing protein, partial [Sphaerospermopsis kisseleviana]